MAENLQIGRLKEQIEILKSALQREKSKNRSGGSHEEFEILKEAVIRERSAKKKLKIRISC